MRCPECNAKISKYPIKKQPEKSLAENFKDGTINWLNFLKMDMMSLTFFVAFLLLLFGFHTQITQYEDIRDDPLAFCQKIVCENATPINEQGWSNQDYPKINLTDFS